MRGELRVDASGLDLDKLLTRVREVMPEALAEGAEHVRVKAVELAPVETGHLVGTATVDVDAERNQAAITFDGPYARYQHERLDLRHPTGGQAKYLEQPLRTEKDAALGVVAKRIKDAL